MERFPFNALKRIFPFGTNLLLGSAAKKKRRIAEAEDEDTDTSTATDDLHQQQPSLPPDTIGRISKCISIGNDLKNMCVAFGPRKDAAADIRQYYLCRNDEYLTTTLLRYCLAEGPTDEAGTDINWTREKCKRNIISWMEVNTDWRKRVTDENMDKYKQIHSGLRVAKVRTGIHRIGSGAFPRPFHPDQIFNNPAVAVELGLVEVLKHLVDKKKIDINSYEWDGYLLPFPEMHLVACVLQAPEARARANQRMLWPGDDDDDDGFNEEPELEEEGIDTTMLDYLLSLDGIDLSSRCGQDDDNDSDLLTVLFELDCPVDTRSFEAFLRHPSMDLSSRNENPLDEWMDRLREWQDYRRDWENIAKSHHWMDKLKLLLTNGATLGPVRQSSFLNTFKYIENNSSLELAKENARSATEDNRAIWDISVSLMEDEIEMRWRRARWERRKWQERKVVKACPPGMFIRTISKQGSSRSGRGICDSSSYDSDELELLPRRLVGDKGGRKKLGGAKKAAAGL